MTVIAWDGKYVATDRLGDSGGTKHETRKLRRLPSGEILAWSGPESACLALAKWYEEGADYAKWPAFQSTEDWGRLIVFRANEVVYFEKCPVEMPFRPPKGAWGSGRGEAWAAMLCGKSAVEAVEIACLLDTGCGLGVDFLEVTPKLAAVSA